MEPWKIEELERLRREDERERPALRIPAPSPIQPPQAPEPIQRGVVIIAL